MTKNFAKILINLTLSIFGGVLVTYYLVVNQWFMQSRLSIWNPLEWVRSCATVTAVLLGDAHQQSEVGAWIGATLSSGLFIAGCIYFIILPAVKSMK